MARKTPIQPSAGFLPAVKILSSEHFRGDIIGLEGLKPGSTIRLPTNATTLWRDGTLFFIFLTNKSTGHSVIIGRNELELTEDLGSTVTLEYTGAAELDNPEPGQTSWWGFYCYIDRGW